MAERSSIDMSRENNSTSSTVGPSILGSGALAGGGAGTLLVALAGNLSADHPWKSWIILLAPACSVILSALVIWIRAKIENHIRIRDTKKLIAEAKRAAEAAIQNPHISQEHRESARKELEKWQSIEMEEYSDRFRSLGRG